MIFRGSHANIFAPFTPRKGQPLGEYQRCRSAIGTLYEMAILAPAREWNQQVEWSIHAPIAERSGIAPDVVNAIAQRRRPGMTLEEEELVCHFCMQLHRDRRVSDATYADALALLCE